jgi:hypothetical protein
MHICPLILIFFKKNFKVSKLESIECRPSSITKSRLFGINEFSF